MIFLRRCIIKEVMDVQKESYFCLMVLAYVIDSDELTYLIDKPTQRKVYKVADISECITNGREYVNSTPHSGDRRIHKEKKIKDLLNNECILNISQLSILGKDAPDEKKDNDSLTENVTTTNVTEVSLEVITAHSSESKPVDSVKVMEHHHPDSPIPNEDIHDSTDISLTNTMNDTPNVAENSLNDGQLVDVLKILAEIAPKFSDIGTALRVPMRMLGLNNDPDKHQDNLRRTLQWWMDNGNSIGSPVTFDTLIEAIEGPIVQNYELAQEIRKLKKQ